MVKAVYRVLGALPDHFRMPSPNTDIMVKTFEL
jgi:hypothetical protein